jgi:aspartate/methionine/tyrosine aminotransferase
VNTLSKTYAMTGWRVGYVAARREIIEALGTLQTYVALSVNAAAQKAGIAALAGPQDSIKRMVEEFRARRDIVIERLNRIDGVDCPVPAGAFYAFPRVEGHGTDSYKLSEYLINEGKVGVYPGIGFGQRGEGRIRISYAASRENLTEGIGRIEAALTKLASSQAR